MTLPPQLQCPCCGTELEECFGRNLGAARQRAELQESANWWRIDHGRHPSCQFRYETFGSGETKEEAWAQARATVENFSKQSTQ